ncbi:hypothetical protein CAter282_2300 [Collimonas arenae]|uniref:Uncharacterized protein n=1 Tax=Collimonas arenae TaxID=279058 RepID=A0A127QJ03_9BURK|nr:hypothetical protein CAter10_2529 [Collimonas arenae]AMP10050.1 hypothetical protein CAter282_2300 [Collimonas arenae]
MYGQIGHLSSLLARPSSHPINVIEIVCFVMSSQIKHN